MSIKKPPFFNKSMFDNFTLNDIKDIQSFIPKTRDEFLKVCQAIYNLKVHREFPLQIFIELTNVCNFACPMCSQPYQSRKLGFMNTNRAEKLINECADNGLYWLGLFMNGESLMHRDFFYILNLAKKKDIPIVNLTTNGYLLNDDTAAALIDSELDTLVISFGGKDKEDYYKIYGKRNNDENEYQIVKDNIIRLYKLRKKSKKNKPFIRLSSKFVPGTMPSEIQNFLDTYKSYTDFIETGFPHNYGAGNDFFGHNSKWSGEFRIPCRKMWRHIVILWNGDVSLCCLDQDGKTVFGNVYKSSIKDLWNSRKRMGLETIHILEDYKKIPFCHQCFNGWNL